MAKTPHLAGITVLDLSSVGPASRCSRILADYGASVVKVGPPPRKSGVQIQPPYWSYSAGRGMRRLQIDLKAPDGRAAFLRLAAKAQVLIESFRPGVAARMGIGWDEVRGINPKIVYCSTSGYGQDGPYARWAGHDLNYLAAGGYLAMSGKRADGGPALPGATVADSAAGGMHAAIAILAALVRCAATGEGEYLDVSVAAGVLWLMSLPIDQHLATGERPAPGGDLLSGRYACYDVYAARDGRWLAVGAIEPAFFANLCKALGLERWIPHQLDDARQDEVRADFRRAFATRDRDEWVRELAPRDTCVAPVYEVAEVVDDPHFRGRVAEARHERHGTFRQLAPVFAGADAAGAPAAVGDATAAETEELLRQVGVSGQEIEKMRREGVVP
jgi:alpha-methylacyl-CoA racemase